MLEKQCLKRQVACQSISPLDFQFFMVQGFLNPNMTFRDEKLTDSLKPILTSYIRKNLKMPIKSVKMKISKKNVPRITQPKHYVPTSKCVPSSLLTHRHTDRQTDRMTTVGTLSGFQDFPLQPIIKDRPNNSFAFHSADYADFFLVVFFLFGGVIKCTKCSRHRIITFRLCSPKK